MELSSIDGRSIRPISITTTSNVVNQSNQQLSNLANSNNKDRPRFIMLRKYSLAICLLEALAIAIIVGYLFLKSPQTQLDSKPGGKFADPLRVYQNESNKTTLLVGLVEGCSQRIHDTNFSVKCPSSDLQLCPTIGPEEGSTQQEDIGIKEGLANVIVTSKSGERMATSDISLARVDCKPNNRQDPCRFKTILTIDKTIIHQVIVGWGGALTDSSINNILALSTNGTTQLLDDYFGYSGIRMNMIRITIGGSDFSSRFYTNLDTPNSDANNPELVEEDILYKIPMLAYIQKKYGYSRPVKIFASMWSPPIWMKTNNHFNKGYLKGSISKRGPGFNDTYYIKLANLKRSFLRAYKRNHVQIWGLTVMNEPIFAVQPFLNFNTMLFPKEEYAEYVSNYLGPIIKYDDQLSHIKLMVHDDNRRFLMEYTDSILENKGARRFIDGVTTHGYIDEDYHLMKAIQQKHRVNPADTDPLFVLPTELCSGHLPFMEKATLGNWHRGVHYAIDIIKGLQNSAAGWVDWNMALDTTGGPGWLGGKLDSPVIVDKHEDAFHKSPMFYVLGQFSRYIPAGSKRLETSITNDLYDYQFETVAFQTPDKTTVVVVLNHNPYEVDLHFRLRNQLSEFTSTLYLVTCKADSVTTIRFNDSALLKSQP